MLEYGDESTRIAALPCQAVQWPYFTMIQNLESPFLKIPCSEFIAANDLAFAIYVSNGHALVTTRRLIATWFQGSDRPSAHSLSPRHPAGLSRHGVSVQWFASEALELTYKAPSGRVANEFPYRHDEPRLQSGVLSREPQADCHRECQAAGFHPS